MRAFNCGIPLQPNSLPFVFFICALEFIILNTVAVTAFNSREVYIDCITLFVRKFLGGKRVMCADFTLPLPLQLPLFYSRDFYPLSMHPYSDFFRIK